MNKLTDTENTFIYGKNPVWEALCSEAQIDTLYLSDSLLRHQIAKYIVKAKKAGAILKEVPDSKLQQLCGSTAHQGMVLSLAICSYVSVGDILTVAQQKGEDPFLIIADELEDPHNLGAIIRTAECVGVHGIIIPKHRSVGINGTVFKTSAGAASYLPVARVTNITAAIEQLKEAGVWVYCADMDGQAYDQADYSGGVALVIGSEGRGVSRLVKEHCDVVVSLPMKGKIQSLNASVAAGILLYEVCRQKSSKK